MLVFLITGLDNTKMKKKKTWKNLIEKDVELNQGAYFGGTPEHIIEQNKRKNKKKDIE